MRSVLPQLRLENRGFLSTNVVRGAHPHSSGLKIATFQYKNSTQSTFPQHRQHLRRATCAESLAQSNMRRATCTEQLHKALAQSNLHRPTCTEHVRKALARSNWRRALAQRNLLRALAQSNLHRAHAQSACTEQLAQSNLHRPTCTEHMRKALARSNWRRALAQSNLLRALARATCTEHLRAESNLRAAAWNNAACADHFREKSRGAVREESRMMRWSSHETIHTEHRRAQTRSPQRCKKVSPRLDEHLWKNAFGPIVL